jgi:hexosaminidase
MPDVYVPTFPNLGQLVVAGTIAAVAACRDDSRRAVPFVDVIPKPASVVETGRVFRWTAATTIGVEPATPEMTAVGQFLADRLKPATGFPLRVSAGDAPVRLVAGRDLGLGDEGYELRVEEDVVTIAAANPAGVFYGVQTLRQLLPPAIEQTAVQSGPWILRTGTIRDRPRFAWRGAMLDPARHFLSLQTVERYVDLVSSYKMNRLHVHLTDDQGWRIAIDGWPRLTAVGGSSEVGGGAGGFYTKREWADLNAYAARRYVTIVPEIDLPGHTNAALASYPDLNCDGTARALYTGIEVGMTTLCIGKATTDRFLKEVLAEIAAMTPGPYLHIGGDESLVTKPDDYVKFMDDVQTVVHGLGKRMIGWEEIAQASHLDPGIIVQHWKDAPRAAEAKAKGVKLIMSPASRTYLNMKYDAASRVGSSWAGFIDERRAYEWDPVGIVPGLVEEDVIGVEAPLWTLLVPAADLDYLAFPRLAGHAEIAWSEAAGRSWDDYKVRIASQGERLRAMGVGFYRSQLIPWR